MGIEAIGVNVADETPLNEHPPATSWIVNVNGRVAFVQNDGSVESPSEYTLTPAEQSEAKSLALKQAIAAMRQMRNDLNDIVSKARECAEWTQNVANRLNHITDDA
jgi:hypothetical protein